MRKKKTNKKQNRAPGKGLRWRPLALTLACIFCIAAILFAPAALLRARDAQILDSFYAMEVNEGSLANPELARQVSLVNAVAMWRDRGKEHYGLDEAELRDTTGMLLEALEDLYQNNLIPLVCVEALAVATDVAEVYINHARDTLSGFELDYYGVDCSEQDAYGNSYQWYFSLEVVMYQGQILLLGMWAQYENMGLYTPEELVEAMAEQAMAPEEETAASVAEMPESGTYADMTGYMRQYIEYLGLDALDDWQVVNDDRSATAMSNYSMLTLEAYYHVFDYGEINIGFTPRY